MLEYMCIHLNKLCQFQLKLYTEKHHIAQGKHRMTKVPEATKAVTMMQSIKVSEAHEQKGKKNKISRSTLSKTDLKNLCKKTYKVLLY